MATSLYDLSVGSYLQTLGAVVNIMNKGSDYFQANNINPDTMVGERLIEDMLPFQFQVISVVHHSMATVKSLVSGEFGIPPKVEPMSYKALTDLVEDTLVAMQTISEVSINDAAGGTVTFKMGETKIPFTSENFVLSFSLPNLHFHAATIYDMLRIKGVELGKLDYLGTMRVGV